MEKSVFNIQRVLEKLYNMYTETEEGTIPKGLYNPFDYGIHYGYNVVASGRGGGKSTIAKLISICAFLDSGVQSLIIRASKTETTRAMCKTYFDDLLNIIFKDGRNAIQHLSNNKYDTIYYYYAEHCFRLGKYEDNPDDLKNTEPMTLITSYEKSSDMCSNFTYPNLKLFICEEICDNRITPNAFMDMLHMISTVFRLDTETTVLLLGNISRGNPDILIKLEVYELMRSADTPYFVHKTKEGTIIHVTLFNALPDKNTQRYKFNKQYFGFDIQGIDVLKGSAQPLELYRELPESCDIVPTNYFINSLGSWFHVFVTVSSIWQQMYYIASCAEPVHDYNTISVTDDALTAYNNPYTYYNTGTALKGVNEFLRAYELNDVCYQNYMCKVAIDTLVRTHT